MTAPREDGLPNEYFLVDPCKPRFGGVFYCLFTPDELVHHNQE